MKLLIALAFSALAVAQPVLKLTGPAYAAPGGTVTLAANLVGSAGNIIAIQNTITLTPAITPNILSYSSVIEASTICILPTCLVLPVTPAPTLVSGSYNLAANSVFHTDPIPEGSKVEIIVFSVPATAALGSTVTAKVDNVMGSDPGGSLVTMTGSTFNISVQTPLSLVQPALTAWSGSPSQGNMQALIQAIITAQGLVGK